MTAVLVTAAARFLGLSTDTKPSSPAPGSTYLETDTLQLFIWTGSAWSLKP